MQGLAAGHRILSAGRGRRRRRPLPPSGLRCSWQLLIAASLCLICTLPEAVVCAVPTSSGLRSWLAVGCPCTWMQTGPRERRLLSSPEPLPDERTHELKSTAQYTAVLAYLVAAPTASREAQHQSMCSHGSVGAGGPRFRTALGATPPPPLPSACPPLVHGLLPLHSFGGLSPPQFSTG